MSSSERHTETRTQPLDPTVAVTVLVRERRSQRKPRNRHVGVERIGMRIRSLGKTARLRPLARLRKGPCTYKSEFLSSSGLNCAVRG